MNSNNFYRTSDFNFVVCAKTAGVEINHFKTNEERKTVWYLENNDFLKKIQEQYYSGRLTLPVQPLFYNQKLIKSQIYS